MSFGPRKGSCFFTWGLQSRNFFEIPLSYHQAMNTQMSRRDFLRLSGFAAAAAALWGCTPRGTTLPVLPTPTTGLLVDADQLLRLALRRITFGPRPDELERAREIGLDAFIEEQLSPDSIADPEVDSRLAGLDTLTMDVPELAEIDQRGVPPNELMRAMLIRAAYSRRQLYEMVVDFWGNHFNIYLGKNQDRILKTLDDREVIRPRAMGKFGDLLLASAHSPAMLVYLDNATSTVDRPNENYARELLELHTLGVDGGYIQADVDELARILTGWTVRRRQGRFMFDAEIHDDGEKSLLGVTFPAGQGLQEGEQALALLAEHPSTADFVCAKLIRRFVSDEPQPALLQKAAAAFRETQGDTVRVLSVILHSGEFRASLGTKLKRPLDFVVSALRQSGVDADINRQTLNFLRQMGQLPFGWPTPDGYPDMGAAWLNSNDLLARWNFALALGTGALREARMDWPGQKNEDFEAILSRLEVQFLAAPLPAEARQVILSWMAALDFDNPALPLSALLMASPQFQYR